MRIHQDVLKCIAFIGIQNDRGEFVPLGTGFIAGAGVRGRYALRPEYQFLFLVTANHVISDTIRGDHFYVRFNQSNSGSSIIKFTKSEGVLDATNDIYMISLPFLRSTHEYKSLSLSREAHEFQIREILTPTPGDEISTVGLYNREVGEDRNVPIIRIGNIARLPGEALRSRSGEIRAYLIETRSILGLSGSPVFLNVPLIGSNTSGAIEFIHRKGNPGAFPIGIMLGYHLSSSAEDQIPLNGSLDDDARTRMSLEEMNTGIAVVVPYERVLDLAESTAIPRALERTPSNNMDFIIFQP